jgi:hypothetical protein
MSKSTSALLGTFSLIPLIGFFLLLALASRLAPGSPNDPQVLFQVAAIYVVGSWLIVIGAMVFAFRSHHIPKSQRILWAMALFFFNMFALPIFWYKCIWKEYTRSQ